MFWLIVMLALMIPLTSILLDSQVGKALAARLEGRAISGGETVTQERIAYLEGEVERLHSEIERVAEESRFVQRLLTERSSDDKAPDALPSGGDDS